MKMMTFRVSEVESFRQWREDDDAELETLLARLRGQTPPSEAMLAGTAFHKALEEAPAAEHSELRALGYTFKLMGDFELAIPAIREIRASKTYVGDGFAVTVSGQLDAIEGKRVEDHKTTGRVDFERYLAGYQWRLYLDIFGADVFRWNVFEIECHEDEEPFGRVWGVYEAHRLEQYRYPDMGADCARLALDLGRFALRHMPERVNGLPLAA
jgi:hypothetical protein